MAHHALTLTSDVNAALALGQRDLAIDTIAGAERCEPGQPVRLRLWRRSPADTEGQEHNVRIEVVERPREAGAMRSS